jgi:hypothetical protein
MDVRILDTVSNDRIQFPHSKGRAGPQGPGNKRAYHPRLLFARYSERTNARAAARASYVPHALCYGHEHQHWPLRFGG